MVMRMVWRMARRSEILMENRLGLNLVIQKDSLKGNPMDSQTGMQTVFLLMVKRTGYDLGKHLGCD